MPLKPRLEKARLSFEDGILTIAADAMTVKAVERGEAAVKKILEEVWGAGTSYRVETLSETPEPSKARKESPTKRKSVQETRPAPMQKSPSSRAILEIDEEILSHPTVQAVLELFDGTIRDVRSSDENE